MLGREIIGFCVYGANQLHIIRTRSGRPGRAQTRARNRTRQTLPRGTKGPSRLLAAEFGCVGWPLALCSDRFEVRIERAFWQYTKPIEGCIAGGRTLG